MKTSKYLKVGVVAVALMSLGRIGFAGLGIDDTADFTITADVKGIAQIQVVNRAPVVFNDVPPDSTTSLQDFREICLYSNTNSGLTIKLSSQNPAPDGERGLLVNTDNPNAPKLPYTVSVSGTDGGRMSMLGVNNVASTSFDMTSGYLSSIPCQSVASARFNFVVFLDNPTSRPEGSYTDTLAVNVTPSF